MSQGQQLFFQSFHEQQHFYRYYFIECDIVRNVLEWGHLHLLSLSLAEHLHILKNMCFICNDKRIGDNSTYSKDV